MFYSGCNIYTGFDNLKFCKPAKCISHNTLTMTMDSDSCAEREAGIMFELLDFARCHGRKILKDQLVHFKSKEALLSLQKLLTGGYLKKINKEGILPFYVLTSRGLNLFGEKRKSQPVPQELKTQITETLRKAITDLEVKPWEVMFHIIYVIGRSHVVTTGDILEYFRNNFGDTKGTSRANVYRNIKHLRMKQYIEYEKETHRDQNQYKLSKKGEEIFYMAKANAAQKLRTSEEWDNALKTIFDRITKQQRKDEQALFYMLDSVMPHDLDNSQVIWILYTQGNVYELKGGLDKAEEAYLRMELLCEEICDSRGRAYALKGLGNVSFKKGKYPVAEQYYKKCWKIAHTLQDTLLLSDVLNNRGSCSYVQGEIDEALHHFEKALELAQHNTARTASTLYNAGLCCARKEDLDKAKELWKKSFNLYKRLQENTEVKWVEYNLREIDRKQKEEHLEKTYRKANYTGTSKEIEETYKELTKFKIDGLIKSTAAVVP